MWSSHEGQTYEARCMHDDGCTAAWIAGYELERELTVETEYCQTTVEHTVTVERTVDGCRVDTQFILLEISTNACPTEDSPPRDPPPPWALVTRLAPGWQARPAPWSGGAGARGRTFGELRDTRRTRADASAAANHDTLEAEGPLPMTNPTLANGNFYFFLRRSGANGLGHMGWGFETTAALHSAATSQQAHAEAASGAASPRLWYFGSLENVSSSFWVWNGNNNYYWTMVASTEFEMLREMQTMATAASRLSQSEQENLDNPLNPYDEYKKIPVPVADPIAAQQLAGNWYDGGYAVLFDNCLDNSAKVSDAYGTDVRTGQRHRRRFAPNVFFDNTLSDHTAIPLGCAPLQASG